MARVPIGRWMKFEGHVLRTMQGGALRLTETVTPRVTEETGLVWRRGKSPALVRSVQLAQEHK